MTKIINQSENGQIFKCGSCQKIHVEYKNLNFNFEEKGFEHFVAYFLNLDGEYWEKRNAKNDFRRKIIVPIDHENVHVLLNNEELQELKTLLSKSLHNIQKEEVKLNTITNSCFCDN